MSDDHRAYNQNVLIGCGSLALLFLFAVGISLILAFNWDRQSARYPGASTVSSHNNYKGLPYHYRWDNTYRTDDPFPRVYHWYSTGFNLGTEARANGGCILLEGSRRWLRMKRYMGVLICDMPEDRLVFVSRSTSFR